MSDPDYEGADGDERERKRLASVRPQAASLLLQAEADEEHDEDGGPGHAETVCSALDSFSLRRTHGARGSSESHVASSSPPMSSSPVAAALDLDDAATFPLDQALAGWAGRGGDDAAAHSAELARTAPPAPDRSLRQYRRNLLADYGS